jgi:hypothetical protein
MSALVRKQDVTVESWVGPVRVSCGYRAVCDDHDPYYRFVPAWQAPTVHLAEEPGAWIRAALDAAAHNMEHNHTSVDPYLLIVACRVDGVPTQHARRGARGSRLRQATASFLRDTCAALVDAFRAAAGSIIWVLFITAGVILWLAAFAGMAK